MEGGKQQSGSSFASDLFGAKDSSPAASSTGIFSSMFPPPPKAVQRGSYQYSETEKKITSENPSWTAKNGVIDRKGEEWQNKSLGSKENSSYYHGENVHEPFHYSSSIYYGGRDVYSPPTTTQNPGPTFNKDVEEDDSDNGASRGNWWRGSLYY